MQKPETAARRTGCAGALHAAARNICKGSRDARSRRDDEVARQRWTSSPNAAPNQSQSHSQSEGQRERVTTATWTRGRARKLEQCETSTIGRGPQDGALDVHRSSKVRVLRDRNRWQAACCQQDEQGRQPMPLAAGPARCSRWCWCWCGAKVRFVCGACNLRSRRL